MKQSKASSTSKKQTKPAQRAVKTAAAKASKAPRSARTTAVKAAPKATPAKARTAKTIAKAAPKTKAAVKPAKAAAKTQTRKHTAPKAAKTVHPKAKITFRHNFLPPIMGVLAFLGVLGFLNGQWVSAQMQYYIMPLHTKSRGVVQPLNLDPNAQPRITIPSVGIDVPYITDETSYDESKVQLALRNGVVHFGTTALPGQIGNMVVIGHSSEALWAPGQYKYAFTLLGKVPDNALVYVDYKGERYIYRITDQEVVEPDDISVLDQSTNTPDITLITCTPIGVSSHRLILHGTQISPSPKDAERAAAPAGIGSATALPR